MLRWRKGWVVRLGLVALTYLVALVCFRAGVDVSDRSGLPQAGLLAQAYYALGLFVLGGMDLGVPRGGPELARVLLWVAYFAAPAITTGAVVEGVLRLVNPSWLARRGLADHVVVVGVGRLGTLFVEALRDRDAHVQVLAVDRDGTHAEVAQAERRFGARFLLGDVRAAATLEGMALERARLVALLTDDDLLNLEAAWRIAERAPRARIIAHVGDIGLRRTVAQVEDPASDRVEVFNGHRIAAERLYTQHLERHFASTKAEDVVVLAGFGRFGQTVLEYLHREAQGEVRRAVLVDACAERQVRLFRSQVNGFEGWELVTIEGSLDDPALWARVDESTRSLGADPVFVVGSDVDQLNLRTAIALRGRYPDALIFVRCVYESAFTMQLSRKVRFEVLATEAMLRRALFDKQAAWLSPS